MYVALQNDAHLESKNIPKLLMEIAGAAGWATLTNLNKLVPFYPLCFFLGEEFFFLFFKALPKKGAFIIYLFALQGPQSLQCARDSLARYLN